MEALSTAHSPLKSVPWTPAATAVQSVHEVAADASETFPAVVPVQLSPALSLALTEMRRPLFMTAPWYHRPLSSQRCVVTTA